MIIRRARAHARHDDQIIPAHDLPLMQAINLPQTAADAVAHDCLAQFGGHGISNAARSMVIFQSIHDHIGRNGGFAFVIKPFKLIILFQS